MHQKRERPAVPKEAQDRSESAARSRPDIRSTRESYSTLQRADAAPLPPRVPPGPRSSTCRRHGSSRILAEKAAALAGRRQHQTPGCHHERSVVCQRDRGPPDNATEARRVCWGVPPRSPPRPSRSRARRCRPILHTTMVNRMIADWTARGYLGSLFQETGGPVVSYRNGDWISNTDLTPLERNASRDGV